MATVRPLAGKLKVTSPFGDRIIGGVDDDHEGVDYRAAVGTLLHAVGNGVVSKVNNTSAGGNQLFLLLDNGEAWAFSHLLDVAVAAGQRVSAGQVVGLTGDTGKVTAPHLHVQAIVGGRIVDPDPLLQRLPSPSTKTTAPATKASGGLLAAAAVVAVVVAATR